jgi:hypothetical protein
MKVKNSAAFGLLLALCLMQGCSRWTYELGTPLSAQETPDKGVALSLTQALEALGPPLRLSALANGYVLAWEHWQIKESAIGLSLGPLGVDFLSLDWGNARTRGEFLVLSFNHNHEMTDSSFGEWDSSANSGAALQPFIGLASVVDIDDLLERLPQHNWGAASLKPLPEAMNSASNPDLGQSGIQRRGTPTGAGQQSLEMD